MKLPEQIADAFRMLREGKLLIDRSKTHFYDGLEVVIKQSGGPKALSRKTGIHESTIKLAMRRGNVEGLALLAERLERVGK